LYFERSKLLAVAIYCGFGVGFILWPVSRFINPWPLLHMATSTIIDFSRIFCNSLTDRKRGFNFCRSSLAIANTGSSSLSFQPASRHMGHNDFSKKSMQSEVKNQNKRESVILPYRPYWMCLFIISLAFSGSFIGIVGWLSGTSIVSLILNPVFEVAAALASLNVSVT